MSRKLADMMARLCIVVVSVYASLAYGGEMKGSGTVSYNLAQIANIPLGRGKFLTEQRPSGVVVATDTSLPFHLSS